MAETVTCYIQLRRHQLRADEFGKSNICRQAYLDQSSLAHVDGTCSIITIKKATVGIYTQHTQAIWP